LLDGRIDFGVDAVELDSAVGIRLDLGEFLLDYLYVVTSEAPFARVTPKLRIWRPPSLEIERCSLLPS
jgi:hypothetical protein